MSKAKRSVWVLSLMLVGGCAASDAGDVGVSAQALQASGDAVSFSEFEDPMGTSQAGTDPQRRLIRSEFEYRRLFGHRSPGIDFWREVVVFYGAGVKDTGGYHASITEITRDGSRLHVTTSLESPGANCRVTESLTHPNVLVRLKARGVRSARFDSQDTTRDCECLQLALCIRGFIFDNSPDVCKCVPDPNAKRCGGFAGTPCPDGQECIDDPSDSCDPTMGGADCGGLCVPGSEPTNPCAAVQCPTGSSCNEKGECIPNPPAVFCGGIANFQCPGLGQCQDDPYDGCDPMNGGADCGGICTCEALAKCQAGQKFDNSPKVCSCVDP
jgi:hypothetical protein